MGGAEPSRSSRRRSRSRSGPRMPSPPRQMGGVLFSGSLPPGSLPPGIQMKEGDWFCPNCEAHNFKRNPSCHECTAWKPGCEPASDDWLCPKCKFNNFRHANSCRGCAAARPGFESLGVNKDSALKEKLVSTIKRRGKESPVFHKRWEAYCDQYGGGFYNP